jgi:hypothetical protein
VRVYARRRDHSRPQSARQAEAPGESIVSLKPSRVSYFELVGEYRGPIKLMEMVRVPVVAIEGYERR